MKDIAASIRAIEARIRAAEQRFGRPPNSVALLAVSKTHPASAVEAAYAVGQRAFGENYLQDALTKISALALAGIEWHFIGAIQSNKTRDIAAHFDWVHTLERTRIAKRLNDQRTDDQPPLNVCIQVNVSDEASKSGVGFDELRKLADQVRALPRLKLRGLMAIPAPSEDFELQRAAFRPLAEAFASLRSEGFDIDTLSIGMTDDLEAAIAEGATMVRIGTAIFGPRAK